MSAIEMNFYYMTATAAAMRTLIEAAQAMSSRHHRSVEFYISVLTEDPFGGFDEMIAEQLQRFRERIVLRSNLALA